MIASEHYDCIVIGAGQAGTPLSISLARSGLLTALIEREHVGGTCVNEGCTPTKTMVASARVAYLARRAADYGVHVGPVEVDLKRVRERKRDIVRKFREGSQGRIGRTPDLTLIFGEAQFTAPRSLRVTLRDGGERSLTADRIFINTGTRPSRPSIEGLEAVSPLDSVSIMELDAVPEHLLILGGGYIGLEFGQMFRRFGSRVTILQSNAQLLVREDTDVADEVAAILRQDGIEVVLGASTRRIVRSGHRILVEYEAAGGQQTAEASHLLLATGRIPNTDQLSLAAAGVETDGRGFIKVNGQLETNVQGVYALGDIKGGPAFTHISYDDFRVIRANLLEGRDAVTDGRPVPYTVFIDPQLGRIGLSENEARAQGRDFRVAKLPMASVARALETDETRGFMKAVVEAGTGQILGAAILGAEGGEIMSLLEIAMMSGLPYTALRDGIFAHPTFAESLNILFTTLDE